MSEVSAKDRAESIFVGFARVRETRYGGILELNILEKDLDKLKENMNKAGWVRLDIGKRKYNTKMGSTHWCRINTRTKIKRTEYYSGGDHDKATYRGK
jgi:hypothetical protein